MGAFTRAPNLDQEVREHFPDQATFELRCRGRVEFRPDEVGERELVVVKKQWWKDEVGGKWHI